MRAIQILVFVGLVVTSAMGQSPRPATAPSGMSVDEAMRRLQERTAARKATDTTKPSVPSAIVPSIPTAQRGVSLGCIMVSLEEAKRELPDYLKPGLPPQKGGVYIVEIYATGSLAPSAIKSGDVIIKIGSTPITVSQDINKWSESAIVGQEYLIAYLSVDRDSGAWRNYTAKVQMLPKEATAKENAAFKSIEEAKMKLLAQKPIGFGIMDKTFRETRFMGAEVIPAAIEIEYVMRNNSDKAVRAVQGDLVFSDLFDHEILRLRLTHTAANTDNALVPKFIEVGSQEVAKKELEFNEFKPEHRKLLTTDLSDMKVRFEVDEILFFDGTRTTFDHRQPSPPPDVPAPSPVGQKI